MGRKDGSAGWQAGRRQAGMHAAEAEQEEGERTRRSSVEAHAATGGSKTRWV
jgi:hypothetical protein